MITVIGKWFFKRGTLTFIPGALHGGWWLEPLARELRRRGHEAHSWPQS